ncbi:hypothetical protein [Isoalcanivorax indicus]|uniref:hypothetical protein n=1 Tax=Isoalcanivorax indicus TaxID=2202653 RepID=UPI000DB90A04|nr:hypothetical protein [Isoalcanivorax indicus]
MPAFASMVPLEESELSEVSGTGLALGFEDLRVVMSPTGYIEATGANVAPNLPYKRADARWYGLSLTAASGSGDGFHFDGTPCTVNDISCPVSSLGFLVPNDNPLILRVWDYQGTSSSGRQYLRRDGTGTNVPTVLELLFPDWHQPLKAAFWGEIAVGLEQGIAAEGGQGYPGTGAAASGHFLQSLTVLDNVSLAGTNVRWMQFDQRTNPSDASDTTFGLTANLRITGDMRFSVNQDTSSENRLGIVPIFTHREGLYFTDVDTFLPLGSLHYQALIGDQVPGGGDFILELTGIPNVEAVWHDFYAHAPGVATHLGYERNNRPERYGETHGHWRIGDQDPATNTCTGPGNCPGQSGIVFRSASEASTFTVFSDRPSENIDAWEDNCTGADSCNPPPRVVNPHNSAAYHQVNIGDVNVEGILMQQLRITTCSTVNGAC